MPSPGYMQCDFDRLEYTNWVSSYTGKLIHGNELLNHTVAGGNFPVISEDHTTAGGRSVLKLKTTDINQRSIYRQTIEWSRTGDAAASRVTDHDGIRVGFRFAVSLSSSNNADVFLLRGGDSVNNHRFELHIKNNGKLYIETDVESSTSAVAVVVSEAIYYDVFIRWTKSTGPGNNDGTMEIWASEAGDPPVKLSAMTLTHDQTNAIEFLDLMCGNDSHASKTWVISVKRMAYAIDEVWDQMGFTDIEELYYENERGMLCLGDGDSETVSFVNFGSPGFYKHTWNGAADLQVKVLWTTEAVWPGYPHASVNQVGPFALPAGNKHIANFAISEGVLPKGVVILVKPMYYLTSAPGDTFIPPNREIRFRLLPIRVTNQDFEFGFGHCMDPEVGQPLLMMKKAFELGVSMFFHTGDEWYELAGASETSPMGTTLDCIMEYYISGLDRFQDELRTQTFFYKVGSDHDLKAANNGDGSSAKGYVDAAVNPTGGDGSNRADPAPNTPPKTLGEMNDIGREAFYEVGGKSALGVGHPGGDWIEQNIWRSFDCCDTRIILLDARSFKDITPTGTEPTSHGLGRATPLGTAQEAWLQGLLADAEGIQTAVIVAEAPFGDVNITTDADPDMMEYAVEFVNEFLRWLNRSTIRQFVLVTGDRHLPWLHNRFKSYVGGIEVDCPKIICEANGGPLGKHKMPHDPTYTPGSGNLNERGVDYVGDTDESTNDFLRRWGHARIRPNAKKASVAIRSGDAPCAISHIIHRSGASNIRGFRSRAGNRTMKDTIED